MSDENVEFLTEMAKIEEKLELTEENLSKINELLKVYFDHLEKRDAAALIAEAEGKIVSKLERLDIPEMLGKFGLKTLKLKTGETIDVKSGISVTVTDEAAFITWLKNRDEYDIVKTLISLSRAMDEEKLVALYEYMEEKEIEYEAQVNIHAKTKESYFNNLLGGKLSDEERQAAIAEGKVLPLDAIKDFAKTFTYFTTKIKEPKGHKYGRRTEAEQF